ncbi:MAG: DsrE/DsrF/DrsH-like family protein [Anaerolineae bacterium]|nr:DsrE/DsrF/DrsH-like family protein [Anaerolineae bacterium]
MDDNRGQRCSIIVFSGDMDRIMGAFIIATTAAALGMETMMFFTFWGLQALKKKGVSSGKSLFGRLLSLSFKDIEGIGPSRLNMGGVGRRIFKKMMKKENVASLSQLRQMAIDLDVRLFACQMSMDVMEIKKEHLVDQVEDVVGAATYVLHAQSADITLFI